MVNKASKRLAENKLQIQKPEWLVARILIKYGGVDKFMMGNVKMIWVLAVSM